MEIIKGIPFMTFTRAPYQKMQGPPPDEDRGPGGPGGEGPGGPPEMPPERPYQLHWRSSTGKLRCGRKSSSARWMEPAPKM